jgi:hypothetical protein
MADRETPRGPWGALVRRAEQAQIPVELFEGNRFVDPDDLAHENRVHGTQGAAVISRYVPDSNGNPPIDMWKVR